MWLTADQTELSLFLTAAKGYWEKVIPPVTCDRYVVVEAFHQDLRVTLRNLAVANALRCVTPARLVVVTGVDAAWHQALWTKFDVSLIRRIAGAYGADTVIDVWQHVADYQRGESPAIAVADQELPHRPGVTDVGFAEIVKATWCRLSMSPHLPADPSSDADYLGRRELARELAGFYATLMGSGRAVALVTSHVDYDQWGLAVHEAIRARVPVIHTQQTGSLKAYALFPENVAGEPTFRAELTPQIGAVFTDELWPRRELVSSAAELVAWRAKGNFGRPSWWRGGAAASAELSGPAERALLRAHAAHRFGFDPDRPIIAIFNHAISDALGTNREVFRDLADWFEQTVEFAASTTEAQWLMLDHPSQRLYDKTGFFESIAARYGGLKHLAFSASSKVSKNALWSLTDLGVTVRGSVGNELPAYGIPVLQAGWSEWSACGLSTVAGDTDEYWKTLDTMIAGLQRGESPITAEQVERARLWLWFYRGLTDVVSPLVPHWEVWPANYLLRAMRIAYRHIECDADPLFSAVDRLWRRREPLLTRFDLRGDWASVLPLRHSEATG